MDRDEVRAALIKAWLRPPAGIYRMLVAGAHLDEISVFSQPWFVDIAYRTRGRKRLLADAQSSQVCFQKIGTSRYVGCLYEVEHRET